MAVAQPPPSAKVRMQQAFAKLSGLVPVEELIKSTFKSDAPLMHQVPAYLLGLGGKRIRPALTLLTARALGMTETPKALVQVAAGIELIHMATLLHDDIIDKSPRRRHKPSPLSHFGLAPTLLSGDFLLVRAFGLCAHLSLDIIEATEAACIDLVEGETLETSLVDDAHTLETSLIVAKKKTAALFRLAAFSAASTVGAGPEIEKLLSKFGEDLGIAFQILDDVLDVASDESVLGKPAGIDLHERKPSIVNVLWLASGSPLASCLKIAPSEDDDSFVAAGIAELRTSKVLSDAKQLARSYADSAREALDSALKAWPNASSEAAMDLMTLIEYTLERME